MSSARRGAGTACGGATRSSADSKAKLTMPGSKSRRRLQIRRHVQIQQKCSVADIFAAQPGMAVPKQVRNIARDWHESRARRKFAGGLRDRRGVTGIDVGRRLLWLFRGR